MSTAGRPNASPFRSIAGVARARRRTPDVERSTFVVCQVAQLAVAFPVEQVERVLPVDAPSAHPTVRLRVAVTEASAPATQTAGHVTQMPRKVTLRADAWTANLVVDHVYDVRAIETARVEAPGDAAPMPAVVGQFVRESAGQLARTVWVIDVARLARAQSAPNLAPVATHD